MRRFRQVAAGLGRRGGGVPVGGAVQGEFVQVRDELGLPYRFPFEG